MPSESGPAVTTTIAAISTPSGRGGIGIIRISGPKSLEISLNLSQRRKKPWQPRHAHLSHWYDSHDTVLDSGICLFFEAPNSYTGEDVIELHGHGNPVLMQAILNHIFTLGAQPAEPGEFTRRAVENGKMDLSQAEAVISSIDAATLRAAHQAQRHLSGEFGQYIKQLMDRLIRILAHLEACLDFPEEDIPTTLFHSLDLELQRDLLHPIDELLDSSDFGERLFHGATIAILGATNVGKSSLLNRFASRSRAIVSELPGTTRDTLEVDFDLHGIPVRLIDTAGIRESPDRIEQEGVQRAKQAARSADLVMFVADISRPETWDSHEKVDLRLMNKVDLCNGRTIPDGFLPSSAETGQGIAEIKHRLTLYLEQVPAAEEGLLVTRARHCQALKRARKYLFNGLAMLGREDQMDLVASEWRQAYDALGSILGRGDVEEIMDHIFSEFCIGK